jgi:gamma-glutamyltranspeptidase/glutathione hydrolase
LAHRKYGVLPWAELVEPAIKLAREGICLTRDEAWVLNWGRQRLSLSEAGKATFFKSDGESYVAGELLVQPDLAWSLGQIAEGGEDAFYRGAIAQRLTNGMEKLGGYITMEDLDAYRAVERPTLTGNYRGYDVVTMPFASGGGTSLIQLLSILENYDLAAAGAGSARVIHLMAEAMKLSFADRWRYAGDTDYVAVPAAGLVSKDYARQRAALIVDGQARPLAELTTGTPWAFESPDTTHFSVVDASGNAVSNTYTIGSDFGSGIMIEGTGFLLGNLIGNFSLARQAEMAEQGTTLTANLLVPGYRPVSSMSPTMVMKDGKPWLITGSPGGSTIISTVAQTIINTVDFDMNIAEATHFPRIFQDIENGKLMMEPGFSPDTIALLQQWGHDVATSETLGSSQSIRVKPDRLEGAADPRRPGALAAPL